MTDTEHEDKGLVDKAKDVAETLKEKVTAFVDEHEDDINKAKDKTKEVAETIKEKVSAFVGDHEEQIDNAIDKTTGFVDEKTKGRYSEKIDKAQEKAKDAVSKLADAGDGAAAADATPDAGPAGELSEPAPARELEEGESDAPES
jgi:pyridoxine 5'-phosphate synthase PdxJ